MKSFVSPKSLFNQSKLLQLCPILCRWGEAVKTLGDWWEKSRKMLSWCDQSESCMILRNIYFEVAWVCCELMNIYIFTVYKVYFQTKDRFYVVFLSDVLQTSAKFSNLTNASREPDHSYILYCYLLSRQLRA